MKKINIDNLISEMTLEEKASLCSAADAWHTKKIERLNLPSVMVSDGPHGLRKEDDSPAHFGLLESIEAICFPTASALACSFDRDLIENVGNALGLQADAGRRRRGQRAHTRRSGAEHHVDRGDFRLRLQIGSADFRHTLGHVGRDFCLRGDRVTEEVAAACLDGGLGQRFVALHQYSFCHFFTTFPQ